jgi:hypothetical protein
MRNLNNYDCYETLTGKALQDFFWFETCIEGGLRSKSADPKAFVLIKAVYALVFPQAGQGASLGMPLKKEI